MLPEAAQEALLLTNSPDCDLASLAKIIQRDTRLATFILRIANSSLFGSPRPIASLDRAVLYIGRRRVQALVIAASLDAISSRVSPEMQAAREALWLHGYLTAVLAVKINSLLKLGFDGEEFTAGLLHDFGRTLILIADPVNAPHLDPLDFEDADGLEMRERALLGVSHADLGAWFALLNELPCSLVSTIQFHHTPESAGEWLKLAALVGTADHAANALQRVATGEPYDPSTNPGIPVLEQAGIGSASKTFRSGVQNALVDAQEIARTMMNS